MRGRLTGGRLLWIWAARDVLRRPGEALLVGLAIAGLVATVATALLLHQGIEATAARLLDQGPSLVVRRLGPAGWQPMPASAVAAAASVPGALSPRLRVWGTARAADLPLTVIGVDAAAAATLRQAGLPTPGEDEVVVGAGAGALVGGFMRLRGPGQPIDPMVTAVLPRQAGLVVHDAALVPMALARQVLGVPAGEGTDLALDVNHASEEDAIRADLARALPFEVTITTRGEAKGGAVASLSRRGGVLLLILLPALLAMALLVAGAARDRAARGGEVGLLKALGWTTADVVRLHLVRSLAVGLPAVALGGAVAWLLVLSPGATWPGALLLGWEGAPPALFVDAAGALQVLISVGALILVPWISAVLWPVVRGATRDPGELLLAGSDGG